MSAKRSLKVRSDAVGAGAVGDGAVHMNLTFFNKGKNAFMESTVRNYSTISDDYGVLLSDGTCRRLNKLPKIKRGTLNYDSKKLLSVKEDEYWSKSIFCKVKGREFHFIPFLGASIEDSPSANWRQIAPDHPEFVFDWATKNKRKDVLCHFNAKGIFFAQRALSGGACGAYRFSRARRGAGHFAASDQSKL